MYMNFNKSILSYLVMVELQGLCLINVHVVVAEMACTGWVKPTGLEVSHN